MSLFLPRPPAPSFKSDLLSCFVLFLPPLVPSPPRRGRPDRPVRVNFAGNSPPCCVGRQKEEKKKEHNQSPTPPSPLPPRFPSKQGAKNSNGEKEVLLFYQPRSFVRSRGSNAHSERGKERESELPHWYNRPSLSSLPFPLPPLFLRRKSSFLLSEEEEGDAISAKSFLWEDTPSPPPLPSYLSPKTPPVLLLLLLFPPSIFHSRESLPLPVVGSPLLQFHRWRRGERRRRWISSFLEIPATSGRDEEGPVTLSPPFAFDTRQTPGP